MSDQADSERMRTRVCHGWAFRDLDPAEKSGVIEYLETGWPQWLDGTTYRQIRDGMYERGER